MLGLRCRMGEFVLGLVPLALIVGGSALLTRGLIEIHPGAAVAFVGLLLVALGARLLWLLASD